MLFLKLYFFLLLSAASLLAQQQKTTSTFSSFNQAYQTVSEDILYGFKTTYNFQKYSLTQVSTFMVSSALFMIALDYELDEEYALEKDYKPFNLPKHFSNVGELYDSPGTTYFTLGLAGTLHGLGKLTNNEKLVQTPQLILRSLILSGIITSGLKIIVGRARPYNDKGPFHYHPLNFQFDPDYMSFPSGHTSSIYAIMSVLGHQFDSYYVKIPAYFFATTVAFQRMNTRKHWASDVLVGATIGFLAGATVVKRNSGKQLMIEPAITRTGPGFAIYF